MRDLLLQLAVTDIFRARWTADIHREWIGALLEKQPHRDRTALERTRGMMDAATRDCLITGYHGLIASLQLPDPDDRHVLAAAIVGQCDAIVTQNLRDFPDEIITTYGIEVVHPDQFLVAQIEFEPSLFCTAVRKVRARLQNPPYSVEAYLDTLMRQGLVATVSKLQDFAAFI
jgi:hypothetical protein